MPNAQLTPRPFRGGLAGTITTRDLDEFQRSLARVVDVADRFQASLSARDKLLVGIGLRAAHAEEAWAHGDMLRFKDHTLGLDALMRQLVEPR